MKSAKVGSCQLNNAASSQIPLPLRRGSSRPEKGPESEAAEAVAESAVCRKKERSALRRSHPERSSVKSSLLASSSFCCGSGQKEDCISDLRSSYSRPLRKGKREQDKSGSDSGVGSGNSGTVARNRFAKSGNDVLEEKPKNEGRLDCSKTRRNPVPDRKNSRVNNLLSSKKKPEAEIDTSVGCNGALLDPEMESGRGQKYTDVIRKLRKDPAHYTPNNLMSLNVESDKLCSKIENVKKLKSGNADGVAACSEMSPKSEVAPRGSCDENGTDTMFRSCDADDLDCPCCNDEDMKGDSSLSNRDSLAEGHPSVSASPKELPNQDATSHDKENDLEKEVRHLQETLETERLNLESQQRYILELENEVRVIQHLKEELEKEKTMRKEAELKLIKLVDSGKQNIFVPSESPAQAVASFEDGNRTPVISTYESRIRSYQGYISKLEEDNAMLVNELKKMKDMSPGSQEEQAKTLLAKLSQLESDNFQQKVEYEKCLDEVANKLVHTLLMQKKIEEECGVLHSRLEQLQLENAELRLSRDRSGDREAEYDTIPDTTVISPELHPASDDLESHTELNGTSEISDEQSKEPATNCKFPCTVSSPGEKKGGISQIPSSGSSMYRASRKKVKLFRSTSSNAHQSRSNSSNHVTTSLENGNNNNNPSKKMFPSTSEMSADKPSESTRNKTLKFHTACPSENSRFADLKRKRSAKPETEGEKRFQEPKMRPNRLEPMSSHTKGSVCADLVHDVLSKDLTSHQGAARPQVQEVWNCSIDTSSHSAVPEFLNNTSTWNRNTLNKEDGSYLDGKLQEAFEIAEKKFLSPLRENECSVSTEGTSRTRDEGYSTMSSDQQQDSIADTTVSGGEEPSSTFVQSVSNLARDDSVTDCLDGSMTSSSDSGFGPLQQITVSNRIHAIPENSVMKSSNSDTQNFDKNVCTYLKDYSNKNSLTIISEQPSQNDCSDSGDNALYEASGGPSFPPFKSSIQNYGTIYCSGGNAQLQVLPSNSSAQLSHNSCGLNQLNPSISCVVSDVSISEISLVSDNRFGELQGTEPSGGNQQCSKPSTVETAEKATLTEPEESTWREKALAHFIDESIWSLYSSESDTQFRLISGDTAKEISPIDSVLAFAKTSVSSSNVDHAESEHLMPATENNNHDLQLSEEEEEGDLLSGTAVTADEDLLLLSNVHRHCPTVRCLERVASDSLLYQKDAVHELEDSMKPCLKASRNFATKYIPLFHHFSASDVCSNQSFESKTSIYPEILMNLEKTMLLNNYISPSSANPSRTSSVCSLPSSNSCHLISDETDDVEVLRHPSRKGSQDPDLSSASDAEYENLDHKDFVERWIQKEIKENRDQIASATCPRNVSAEKRRPSFPFSKGKNHLPSRQLPNFLELISSGSNVPRPNGERGRSDVKQPAQINPPVCPDDAIQSPASPIVYPIIFTCENIDDDFEPTPNDVELDVLDSEVKEFNDDFYRLCDVGSSLSIDHTLPTILESLDCSLKSHSKLSPTLKYKFPQNEELPSEEPSQMPKVGVEKPTSKPTVFVKPVRPVTLSFCNVPNATVKHRFRKIDLGKSPTKEQNLVKTTPNFNRDQKMRKVSSPKKPAPSYARKIATKSITKNSCTVSGGFANVESFYKLQPSLPVNQNIEASRGESRNKSVATNLTPDHHPDFVNLNRNLPRKKNDNCFSSPNSPSPTNAARRHYWKKDRFAARNSKEGCGTAWIHLQADDSLSDPKTRASLLDSMATTVSSSGSSSEEEEESGVPVQSNTYLQKICREKRKRIKASRAGDFMAMSPRQRSTVINRHSLYYRYGEREKEAIACFDFLEEIPTSSSEHALSDLSKRASPPSELDTSCKKSSGNKERVNLVSPCTSETNIGINVRSRTTSFTSRLKAPILWNQPIMHNMSSSTLNSQDYEILDHVSLSDSCAESYTSTPDSFEDVCT